MRSRYLLHNCNGEKIVVTNNCLILLLDNLSTLPELCFLCYTHCDPLGVSSVYQKLGRNRRRRRATLRMRTPRTLMLRGRVVFANTLG